MGRSSGVKIHYLSLLEAAELIRTKQISPVELTRLLLERIALLDPLFNSYATLMKDQALVAASKAEFDITNGSYCGPLHGIPVAVKDLCYTMGVPTKGGLKVLSDFVPDFDATVVTKLKQAGAVLLGKLNLTEGAVGGYHRNFKIPVNSWRKDLWTGSSSSGSGVATAAGLCFGSLGSDTGGSIRFPSMANGIVGLKPTYGRVSRYGILPLAESMDHIGPMTRTVADAAVVLEAISGVDPHDQTSLREAVPKISVNLDQPITGLKIGYDESYTTKDVDTELLGAFLKAISILEHLGVEIIPAEMPDITGIRETWRTICTYEAAKAHSTNYPSRAEEYGAFFGDFLKIGSEISKEAYLKAMQKRMEFNGKFCSMLNHVDAFICPGAGVPCSVSPGFLYQGMKEIRAGLNQYTYFQFTIPANFAGTPSLSLPCGVSENGPPYTLQLIGTHLSEPTLCRIGHAYEQVTQWHYRHPNI